jgi:hypothetical protein
MVGHQLDEAPAPGGGVGRVADGRLGVRRARHAE